MVSDGAWYVLIEEDEQYAEFPRWVLAETVPAEGGREQAQDLAEELALSHRLRRSRTYPPAPRRRVFRLPGDSWLVELTVDGFWARHFRLSIAELVHDAVDAAPAPLPAPAPTPAPAPGLLKRAFGRG